MLRGDRGERSPDLGGFGILLAVLFSCALVGGLAYLQGRESERRYQSPHEHTEDAKTAAREACFNTQTIDPVD